MTDSAWNDLIEQIEQAEARVAELESEIEFIGGIGSKLTKAATLRKQAEAVERATLICRRDGIRPEVSTASCPVYALNDYAKRLRQQADELEQ